MIVDLRQRKERRIRERLAALAAKRKPEPAPEPVHVPDARERAAANLAAFATDRATLVDEAVATLPAVLALRIAWWALHAHDDDVAGVNRYAARLADAIEPQEGTPKWSFWDSEKPTGEGAWHL